MSQSQYIKDIAKYGLENDRHKLLKSLNDFIEHSRQSRKVNLAIALQDIVKNAKEQTTSNLVRVGSKTYEEGVYERELGELVLEKLVSNYSLDHLIAEENALEKLKYFIEEHKNLALIQRHNLPVSNKLLLYGPSGCGKTLASYVLSGELDKVMYVINLGAIVSSKLGETSKNLAKIFRKASSEDCIIFMDEFDSLGKVRDYNQDHAEMKRVTNTILQLFDYLPQTSLLFAATNQKDMLDPAVVRRFDYQIELTMPKEDQIKLLIDRVLQKGKIQIDQKSNLNKVIRKADGLSYYSIQKTLVNTIKRSLFQSSRTDSVKRLNPIVETQTWLSFIEDEKTQLG